MVRVSVFVFVCFVLLSVVSFKAQCAPETKQNFQSLYTKIDTLMKNKDVDSVMSLYSTDYVETDIKGRQHDYSQSREGIEATITRYNKINGKTIVDSVKVIKTGVIVLVHEHSVLVRDDENTGKEVVIVGDEKDRDFWIKTGDGWKLRQEKSLSAHYTKNGVAL